MLAAQKLLAIAVALLQSRVALNKGIAVQNMHEVDFCQVDPAILDYTTESKLNTGSNTAMVAVTHYGKVPETPCSHAQRH